MLKEDHIRQAASAVVDVGAYRTSGPRHVNRSRRQPQNGLGQVHAPTENLWADYKRSGTRAARDRLIVHYSRLVEYVASRVSMGLPDNIERADLVSYGMFGLIDAIEKFDMSRNLKFETYAVARIRGAIIDELRRIDWVPRLVRTKARWVDQARANLESRLLRTPTTKEVAAELGITEEELQEISRLASARDCVSLDGARSSARSQSGEATRLADPIEDLGRGPSAAFEREEMKHILANSINGLADRERTVLARYYYEGETLAQIGKSLGLTESRVCQIHARAIARLRDRVSSLRESA
jgi:RNA polymerase sigma factor for flagellar operon FliA